MVWFIASAKLSHVRVIEAFFEKYVLSPFAGVMLFRETEIEKTLAVKRLSRSTVVAVLARE